MFPVKKMVRSRWKETQRERERKIKKEMRKIDALNIHSFNFNVKEEFRTCIDYISLSKNNKNITHTTLQHIQ